MFGIYDIVMNSENVKHILKKPLGVIAAGVMAFSLSSIPLANTANACCSCVGTLSLIDPLVWQEAEDDFDEKINDEFLRLENFIVHEMWEESILPAMMLMTEQLTAVAIQQAMIIGTFFDAKNQLETQQLHQVLQARAHKDYIPSVGICEFGTRIKSLAATERKMEMNAYVLSQRSQDRQLGHAHTSGTYGNDIDKDNRLQQFGTKYCSEKDRDSALNGFCSALGWAGLTAAERIQLDRDIDYTTVIDLPWTIKMDFSNQVIDGTTAVPPVDNIEEEDVLALASNLFAHDIFPRAPARLLVNKPDEPPNDMQKTYMDLRAVVAKRGVAENSFNSIAAMKAEGNIEDDAGTPVPMTARVFLEPILLELGVPPAEVLDVIGENPSYYAQMELLTKKVFQNPDFYTNLYDTPANVDRKAVSLQAIKMMQKFDLYRSFLRNEASFAVLLELAVTDLQNEIEDQIRISDMTDNR